MLCAFVCSTVFLGFYLYFHFHAGLIRFGGQGWIRPVYFTILISHTILAVLSLPLVLVTLSFALSSRFAKHRRIARWTLPDLAIRVDYRSDRLLAAVYRLHAHRRPRVRVPTVR